MPKKNTTPKRAASSKSSDLKITVILVLCVAALIAALVFFNKPLYEVKVASTVQPPVVQEEENPFEPSVKPLTPSPIAKAPVKKPVQPKAAPTSGTTGSGRIAFIIDDWGQSLHNCKYLKAIDAPMAVAILPSLPHSNDVAKCASLYNKTIMLHLPLQAYHNHDPYPTDYIIKTEMNPDKVEKILNNILAKMPYIEGVNNHMGSKATEDKNLMKLILRRFKKNNLFFVDSMTAPDHSVAWETASELSIPYAKRDVFLDNINTRDAILKQLQSLTQKASQKGYAIAIGHDRDLTMKILAEQIPLLKQRGFTVVGIKDLLKSKK